MCVVCHHSYWILCSSLSFGGSYLYDYRRFTDNGAYTGDCTDGLWNPGGGQWCTGRFTGTAAYRLLASAGYVCRNGIIPDDAGAGYQSGYCIYCKCCTAHGSGILYSTVFAGEFIYDVKKCLLCGRGVNTGLSIEFLWQWRLFRLLSVRFILIEWIF